jgi:hypothetical protein
MPRHRYSPIELLLTCPHCSTLKGELSELLEQDLQRWGEYEPGDAVICYRCGEASVCDEHLRFRKPTPSEAADLASLRWFNQAIEAWNKAKRERTR